jgi:hypothetical protein
MQVIFIFISALAFIFYGLLILVTNHMKIEFRRYGLSQFRMLTGALELLGGAGLLLGFYYLPLLIFSAGGLALLMLLGVIVRLKTRDPLDEIIPAFVLMLINIAILFSA